MKQSHEQFSSFIEPLKRKIYDKSFIDYQNFQFSYLNSISVGSTIQLIHFFLIENENQLVHQLKIAFYEQANLSTFLFEFHNPFSEYNTVTNLVLEQHQIPLDSFLIPLLKNHIDCFKEDVFPLISFLNSLNISLDKLKKNN